MSEAYGLRDDQVSASGGVYFEDWARPASTAERGGYEAASVTPDQFSPYEDYDFAGWDGDEAEPILAATVRAARYFNNSLPRDVTRPDVAPGVDGTIGFEWRLGRGESRVSIFVEVAAGNRIRAQRKCNDRVERWDWQAVGVGAYRLVEELFQSNHERF